MNNIFRLGTAILIPPVLFLLWVFLSAFGEFSLILSKTIGQAQTLLLVAVFFIGLGLFFLFRLRDLTFVRKLWAAILYVFVEIVILFFIFFAALNFSFDKKIVAEWEKAFSCSDLGQQECDSSEICQSVYGPSSCSGDNCTADLVYRACTSIQ